MLKKRDNQIHSADVPTYIEKIKSFLGIDSLAQAQSHLEKDLSHHGRCYSMLMEHNHKWLFALRSYDQITKHGTEFPQQWPIAIQQIVGDAFMISSLIERMPESVK